jgi:hypothetical protein
VEHVRPEVRLLVVALVQPEREELPPVFLRDEEVLEQRDEDARELAGDIADRLGKAARESAHLLRGVLGDRPEVVLPLREEVVVEERVRALEELQDLDEDARELDPHARDLDIAEVG